MKMHRPSVMARWRRWLLMHAGWELMSDVTVTRRGRKSKGSLLLPSQESDPADLIHALLAAVDLYWPMHGMTG
jgi:hypothetical protein